MVGILARWRGQPLACASVREYTLTASSGRRLCDVRPEDIPGGIWVFQNVLKGRFAGGLFTTREAAEQWIEKNGCSGVLTLYPVDVGVVRVGNRAGSLYPEQAA